MSRLRTIASHRYGAVVPYRHCPIVRGQARNALIGRTADILREWRFSRFEHEASTVYGLRAALVLLGNGWHAADTEAREIVNAALRILGYRRPSWLEGQREYTISPDRCKWCGTNVPEDMRVERPSNYCSDVCARAALTWRDFEQRETSDASYFAARDALVRGSKPARHCAKCGDPFRPSINDRQRYCSKRCAATDLTLPEKTCPQCGTKFNPRLARSVYCSQTCKVAAMRSPERPCGYCGTLFHPERKTRAYCSNRCAQLGKRPGLSPYRLDQMVCEAATELGLSRKAIHEIRQLAQ